MFESTYNGRSADLQSRVFFAAPQRWHVTCTSIMNTSIPLVAGPQLLGLCFNWALLGLLNHQIYIYYERYPKDLVVLKCLVYMILVSEWVQTGLITASEMDMFVYNFGNPLSLFKVHNGWFSGIIMSGIISAAVQFFFAWRIYLSTSRILSCVIFILVVAEIVASVVTGALSRELSLSSKLRGRQWDAALVWLLCSSVIDILIAVIMVALLLRRRSGLPQSDALVNRVIRLIIGTGSLTAGVSILVLVFNNSPSLRDTMIYETPSIIITKLYSNSLLTSLNGRAYISRHGQSVVFLSPTSDTGFVTTSRTVAFASGLSTGDTTAIEDEQKYDNLPCDAHVSRVITNHRRPTEACKPMNRQPAAGQLARRNSIV